MKKIFIGVVTVIFVILFGILYLLYLCTIDTKYAIKYSKVMGSYDIAQVDAFLNEDTMIIYKDASKKYKELRNNIIKAFDEKIFYMAEDSSYGHGKDFYGNTNQTIGIQSTVTIGDKNIEVYIEMKLKQVGINTFKIESLCSNNEFFGYLFFRDCIIK